MRKRKNAAPEPLQAKENQINQEVRPTRSASLKVIRRSQVKLPARRREKVSKDQRQENPNQSPRAQRVNKPDNAVAAQIVAAPAARAGQEATSRVLKSSRANLVKRDELRKRLADR